MPIHLDPQPYWADSAAMPMFPTLDRDEHADVIVIGGGITGLTTAYLLGMAGQSVVLLERGRCAQVDTGHTSAHVTMVTDTRLTELVSRFGREHAQAVWDSGLAALAQMDAIVRTQKIACDFEWVDGYLHAQSAATSSHEREEFAKEAALAVELGFDADLVSDTPLVRLPGLRFAGQARVHPRKYLAGLVKAVTANGVRIYEDTEAGEFCQKPLSIKANGHHVTGGDVVIATHNPLVGLSSTVGAALFQTKLARFTSYVIAGRVPKGRVPDALMCDTGDPYHYMRIEPQREHDLVIFGGEDHKTGQVTDTDACYTRLERTLLALLPEFTVSHRWSGQVIETPDGLPFIGESADHQYSATGYGGNGMTFGTLGAMMSVDLILGRSNPWTDLFSPDRKALGRSMWDYVKQNADYPYYMIRDRFAGKGGRTLRSVRRGHGKVIDHNGSKVAAYRDDDGAVTMRSAVCTHMGCLVAWNNSERTWDCPCHGSRFKPGGDVLSGPAEAPLAEVPS